MSNVSPVWHPMTQHKTAGTALPVVRAEGAYLYTRTPQGQERAILDGISSWWVNTHGHCHPKIVKSVQDQAGKLDQVIFAGLTHDPAERLTRKLLSVVRDEFKETQGSPLEFTFYSDSGSTSVEVALKMAIGFFAARGEPRHKIIALEGGYHGDTFGAMAAGSRGIFNAPYEHFLFDVTHLPFPAFNEETAALQAFEGYLKTHGAETAAFIFEPIMQGAAGMRPYSPAALQKMAMLCRDYGVLLIADEVMTGFGRMGSLFATAQAGFTPDLLCLSKGLTGGFLPMGATLATRKIYKAFYADEKAKQFFHSTSFTANPLACAAGLASLEIWEEEPVLENIKTIEKAHHRAAGWFSARPDVVDVRVKGSVFAIEIQDTAAGYLSDIAVSLYDFMLSHDILLRPIGNVVYILPPYCIKAQDLERIYETLWQALDSLRSGRSKHPDSTAHHEHTELRQAA